MSPSPPPSVRILCAVLHPRVRVMPSRAQEALLWDFLPGAPSPAVVTAVGAAGPGDGHLCQRVGAFFSPPLTPLIFLCWVLFQNHYSFLKKRERGKN